MKDTGMKFKMKIEIEAIGPSSFRERLNEGIRILAIMKEDDIGNHSQTTESPNGKISWERITVIEPIEPEIKAPE